MNSTAYANRAISPFRRFNSQRTELFHILVGHLKCSGRSFNSQHDGILFTPLAPMLRLRKVSIPNGMEFYIVAFGPTLNIILFQFPTGWNSTRSGAARKHEPTSFNSQRDGILPGRKNSFEPIMRKFQFPTGWNSTRNYPLTAGFNRCSFNSQRDGILPWEICKYPTTL